MHCRTHPQCLIAVLLAVVVLLVGSALASAQDVRNITVAVVFDGPSTELASLQQQIERELTALSTKDFQVDFPAAKVFDGGWSRDQITKQLQKLQIDPDVDFVLMAGYIASATAISERHLLKPTFAPLVVDMEVLNSTSGRYTEPNLNYLVSSITFDETLRAFVRITRFRDLVVLIDQAYYDTLAEAVARAVELAAAQGVRLRFVTDDGSSVNIAAQIPLDTEAVMLAPLPRLTMDAQQQLINELIVRRLPSFSWVGEHAVERGVLATMRSASERDHLARRTALNMWSVLRGEPASAQPVRFEERARLILNMATAKAIGVSPPFDVLNDARQINESGEGLGETLSLADAALRAVAANLDIIAGELGVTADAENVVEARSLFFPQVFSSVDYSKTKSDTPFVNTGFNADASAQAGIGARQLIFSEQARATLDVQKELHVARQAQQRGLELDVIQQTVSTFLSVLIAQTQLQIQENNLGLTRTNLDLARNRVRLGASDRSDVYRWESEVATVHQSVLQAKSQVEQAHDALNQLLNRPITDRFTTEPATLSDPGLLVSRLSLLKLLDNQQALDRLGDYFVNQGIDQSPELSQVRAQINAQARQLKADRRAYWLPEVALTGNVAHVFDESRIAGATINLNNETDWAVGLQFTLPLYEGGARRARRSRSDYSLRQLRTQQDNTQLIVEQAVRRSLHAVRASYPSIDLSAQAATAAHKNYELVSRTYVVGTRSIIDLLDAQNSTLTADQAAANAVFNFLVDLMNLQRASGEFDFFLDGRERDARAQRIEDYINDGPGRSR